MSQVLSDVDERVTRALTRILPGLIAAVAIVVLAIVAAFVLRTLVRYVLTRVRFDERVDQWGIAGLAEWSPGQSPARLAARVSFLTVLAVGALVALSALDPGLSSLLVERLFDYVPHVLAAVIILFAGIVVARVLARGVLISAVNMRIQSARLLSIGVKWLVIVLTLAMTLDHLGLGGVIVQVSFTILLGGIVLALALAVGLGSKEMVRRSWERQEERTEHGVEERFHHL